MTQRLTKHCAVMYIGPVPAWRGKVGRVTCIDADKALVYFPGDGPQDERTLRANKANLVRVRVD